MIKEKAALRKELLSLRKAASPVELDIDTLNSYSQFCSAETVLCYVSAYGEVGTHNLIKELLSLKRVVVPCCTDRCGNMICSEIKSFNDLKEGFFGILEPKSKAAFPKEKIDFAIVPGIAFDKEGYRLGYGKGYYDRFLSDITFFKLGVCQEEFYFSALPHGKHDIRMDSVLTVSTEKRM